MVLAVVQHLRILLQAAKGWMADKAFQHAAALAFYTLFSMAPLLILVITITGLLFGQDAAEGQLFDTLEAWLGAEGAVTVQAAIVEMNPQQSGWLATVLGFCLLAIGATTVFGQLQLSLNQIWGVAPSPRKSGLVLLLKTRLLSLTLVLTIGFLLLVSFFLTTALSTLIRFSSEFIPLPVSLLQITDITVSFLIISVLFGAIFKVLPDVILPWREALYGSAITAGLFIVGKYLIAIYISHTGATSAYGAAGSLVAILIWVNYSGLILLYGVQVTKAYAAARGMVIRPKSTAVRMIYQPVVED